MTEMKPRTTAVVIYQGDDLAMLEELDEQVSKAQRDLKSAEADKTPRLMHERDTTADLREALDSAQSDRDEFAAEAAKRGVRVILCSIGRKWRGLVKAHPPRTDDEGETIDGDKLIGVNMETFAEALVPMSILSGVEGDKQEFIDSLTDFDFERLFLAAFHLNRSGSRADPTQRLVSASRQTNDAS